MSQTHDLKTLSEIVKQKREELHLSCERIAEILRIPARYLVYLENNELKKLPPPIYVKGFLKKYSHILNLDSNRVLQLYDHELHALQASREHSLVAQSVENPRIIISTRSIVFVLVTIAILGLGVYWWKQISLFFTKPSLMVLSPERDTSIENNAITVEGKTKEGNSIDINNQSVVVNNGGSFKETLFLQDGLNILTVTAKDTYGKKNIVVRKVVFSEKKPFEQREFSSTGGLTAQAKNSTINNLNQKLIQDTPQDTSKISEKTNSPDEENIDVQIKTQTKSSWIKISSGNDVVYSGIMLPGVVKSFQVNVKDSTLRVSSAEHVLISINKSEFKPIGKKGEKFLEVVIDNEENIRRI